MRHHPRPSSISAPSDSGSRALWWRWVLVVSAGELAGFTVPGALAVWTHAMPSEVQVVVLVAAGTVEGALLGTAQALVLRRVLPGFRTLAWVVATSVAAGLAWFLGRLPSATQAAWTTWPVGAVAVAASLLGTGLLVSIGAAQALVLPAGASRPLAWVGWTALGWCAGLLAFSVVAPPLWHEGQAPAVTALIGVVGGAAMAVVMSAVTGLGVLRLREQSEAPWSGGRVEGREQGPETVCPRTLPRPEVARERGGTDTSDTRREPPC